MLQGLYNKWTIRKFTMALSMEAIGLHSGQTRASATGLAILPVKVKAKGSDQMIQTYAFLDNGSNTSFCSEKLANQLNLSGKRTTLLLTTMERENSKTDCRVVSLEVLDLDEENLFELPVVFTRPNLPVTTESAANQQDVEKWQYLSEVKIPNIDADVSLLIGSDAPEILEPKGLFQVRMDDLMLQELPSVGWTMVH